MRISSLTIVLLVLASACTDGEGSPAGPTLGPDDETAAIACREAASTGLTTVVAQSSRDDAGMSLIGAAPSPYTITLPEGASSFLSINLAEMHNDWAVFTSPHVDILSISDESGAELTPWTATENAACTGAGMTDYRFHGHTAGTRTIEFSSEGPRSIWLMFMLVGDGGHSMHDGGHSMHDGGS